MSRYQVGFDQTSLMKAWMERTLKRLDEADERAKVAQDEARHRGELQDTIFVVARKLGPNRYRVNTVAGLPAKLPALEAYGDNPEHACTRLRWLFVQGLRQTKVEPELEAAKARGRKVRFEVVDVIGDGKVSVQV